MKKTKKEDSYIFAISLAVPKKLGMGEAVDFVDKEISQIRRNILEQLAKRYGVKLQYSN